MEGEQPIRKEGVLPRQVGSEWILYDTESGGVHVINPTAAKIWDLCDGAHTPADMETVLRETYDAPESTPVGEQVLDILAQFAQMQVVRPADAGEAAP